MTPFKPTSGLTTCGVRRMRDTTPATPAPVQGESGLTTEGLRRSAEDVTGAKLSTQQRKNLDSSDFVFPDKAPGPGSCPIPDAKHGSLALQICRGDKATIKSKVCSKFPSLPACDD